MNRLSRRLVRRRLGVASTAAAKLLERSAADHSAADHSAADHSAANYTGFVCTACRRELPIADRSRIAPTRCRACA
jgi:hypothetical protein